MHNLNLVIAIRNREVIQLIISTLGNVNTSIIELNKIIERSKKG